MIRENQRKTFRRQLDNALPDLVNTLDDLRKQKEIEENRSDSDDFDFDQLVQNR